MNYCFAMLTCLLSVLDLLPCDTLQYKVQMQKIHLESTTCFCQAVVAVEM